ncbi:hypothetical protein P692DRAFT_20884079 [Suillus brevipes Sb2]|nr:hypothetical protein P692DRAFT_20884079 [Suillus brevipes Sb2]
MDALPPQTSSVPSAHVFSSSNEICTDRRANLSPPVLKALRTLKLSNKQVWLNHIAFLGTHQPLEE